MSFALSVHLSLISYIVNYATERARERCQIKTKGAEERTLKGEKEISMKCFRTCLKPLSPMKISITQREKARFEKARINHFVHT